MLELKVQCPAKINLTLEILNKREDGFHNIQSVMQTISLYDILTINIEDSEDFQINLSGTTDDIPYDESNLVYKAAELFFATLFPCDFTEVCAQLPRPGGERVGVRGQYKTLYNEDALEKAKELRKNTTDAERVLWCVLRNRQLNNLKFKRQVPIGNYIVDFMSKEKKVIIELDGGGHVEENQIKHDLKRTQFLEAEGYKVIRFFNPDVFKNLDGVVETILYNTEGPLTPTLSPQGRGSNANAQGFNSATFKKKVSIHIEKNIPISAGLAGGSTDAAGALWGLNKLMGNPLAQEELHEICTQLGSDLNFCLEGGCQLTTGRGEVLEKLPFIEFDVSLIKPENLGISAKEAYTKFSSLENKPNLNMTEKLVNELNSGSGDIEKYITNDLEAAVIDDYEELQEIKTSYPGSIMSGSGSTFFIVNSNFKPIDESFWVKTGLKSVPEGVSEHLL